ncbi:MAG: sulfite exporter TauE/SafE family protein [Polyangiales bacterium]
MILLVASLSLAVGLSLGLLGGGGSILTLPMLVYIAGLDARAAIASSLLVVGVTSAVAVIAHARAGAVQWRVGGVFAAAAMVGAYAGGRVAHFVPATALLAGFATLMLVTSIAMMRGRRAPEGEHRLAVARVLGVASLVGSMSGLLGAGGGFLVVPALALFGGLEMRKAIGTSLFVIALQSAAGFAGQAQNAHLDARLLAVVSAAAVVGTLGGARLARRVSPDQLRRGFAWLVLAMGVFVLARQIPLVAALGTGVAGVAAALFVSRSQPTTPATGT